MDEIDSVQRLQRESLEEEYRRRHGAAIALLKEQIGPGEVYENAAARALVSDRGAWFECVDLPVEFSGAAGTAVERRFVSDSEVLRLLGNLFDLTERANDDSCGLGLFVLYDRRGVFDARYLFAFQREPGLDRPTIRIGDFRPDVLPLAFRCRLTQLPQLADDLAPFQTGALFCLADIGERNLLVTMSYEGDALYDLAAGPDYPAAQ